MTDLIATVQSLTKKDGKCYQGKDKELLTLLGEQWAKGVPIAPVLFRLHPDIILTFFRDHLNTEDEIRAFLSPLLAEASFASNPSGKSLHRLYLVLEYLGEKGCTFPYMAELFCTSLSWATTSSGFQKTAKKYFIQHLWENQSFSILDVTFSTVSPENGTRFLQFLQALEKDGSLVLDSPAMLSFLEKYQWQLPPPPKKKVSAQSVQEESARNLIQDCCRTMAQQQEELRQYHHLLTHLLEQAPSPPMAHCSDTTEKEETDTVAFWKEKSEDLEQRLKTALHSNKVIQNIELQNLRETLSNHLRSEHHHFFNRLHTPCSEEEFLAYRATIKRIFLVLSREGIEF